MGATKTNQYSTETVQLANLAKALAHPARITIIKTLKEKAFFRNVEFQSILQLSASTVHTHISKLKSANLIAIQYFPHEYHVSLIPENLEDLDYFISNSEF